MSLLADRRPWLHDLCRRADATALCWWRYPGGRTRLQIRRLTLSDAPEEVGAALWADDGRGVEVLAPLRPDPVPRPDLLAEIPHGLSRLVAGLSAHERLERTRTEPLPVLDGAPFAPLLSPPLGHRLARIPTLRQGRDVATVEGDPQIPLFALLP